jgi:hypothetical protein
VSPVSLGQLLRQYLQVPVTGKMFSVELPFELGRNTLEPSVVGRSQNHQFELIAQFMRHEAKLGVVLAEFRVLANQMLPSIVQFQVGSRANLGAGYLGFLHLLLHQQLRPQAKVVLQPVLVAKDLIGLLNLVKSLLGFAIIILITIWMKFLGQCPMGRFDHFRGCLGRQT